MEKTLTRYKFGFSCIIMECEDGTWLCNTPISYEPGFKTQKDAESYSTSYGLVDNRRLFNVIKTYDGYPSKTKTELSNVSSVDAEACLQLSETLWRKNGGLILSSNIRELVCEESDGSNIIRFTIKKIRY